jgi:hypothetical protein
MEHPLLVMLAILGLGMVYVMLPVFLSAFKEYHQDKNVTCTENGKRAFIRVDAEKAALTSLIGDPKLRIHDCSLWNGVRQCKQECLDQLKI